MAQARTMSLDSVLATYLDLLALIDEPLFRWGPAELRAAFQWGHTLQQLLDTACASAAVRQRLQVHAAHLPPGMQPLLPAIGRQPLRLVLERLLLRTHSPPGEGWLEAVLAAYAAAVVLPASGDTQQAAEQLLLDTLTHLRQAAAVQRVSQGAAQRAAAAALAAVPLARSGSRCGRLRREALRFFACPDSLQMAAAAELLARHAPPLAEQHAQQAVGWLDGELDPASPFHLELMCWLALLPVWEHMLQRLASHGSNPPNKQAPLHGSGSSPCSPAWCPAQQRCVQLLCEACASHPQTLLQVAPELLAEVCRQSFRFTCGYAGLLRAHLHQAARDTAPAAAAAHHRLAHAVKHADHVSDYLRAKCCVVARTEHGEPETCLLPT